MFKSALLAAALAASAYAEEVSSPSLVEANAMEYRLEQIDGFGGEVIAKEDDPYTPTIVQTGSY